MANNQVVKQFLDFVAIFYKHKEALTELISNDESIHGVLSYLDYYSSVIEQFNKTKKTIESENLASFTELIANLNDVLDNYLRLNEHDKKSYRLFENIHFLFKEFELKDKFLDSFLDLENIKVKSRTLEEELIQSRLKTDEIEELYKTSQRQFDELNKKITPFIEKVNSGITSQNFGALANRNFLSALVFGVFIIALIWIFGCYLANYIINGCFEFKCLTSATLMYSNKDVVASGEKLIYLEIFKAVFYRLLIVSIALYLLKFLVTNFKSSMHNYTINKHRAASIESSIFLIDRTNSTDTKEQLLLLVANAIFAHQPTGYNDKEPENINFAEKVLDKTVDKIPDLK